MRERRERKRDYRYGGRRMVLPRRNFVPRRREPVASHYWRRLEYGLLQDQPMRRQGMKIPHLQGPASRAMTTPMPIMAKAIYGQSCESAPDQGREEEEKEETPVMARACCGELHHANEHLEN